VVRVLDAIFIAQLLGSVTYVMSSDGRWWFASSRFLNGAVLLQVSLFCNLASRLPFDDNVLLIVNANIWGGTLGAVVGSLCSSLDEGTRYSAVNSLSAISAIVSTAVYALAVRRRIASNMYLEVTYPRVRPTHAALIVAVGFCAGACGLSMDQNSILLGTRLSFIDTANIWILTCTASLTLVAATVGLQLLYGKLSHARIMYLMTLFSLAASGSIRSNPSKLQLWHYTACISMSVLSGVITMNCGISHLSETVPQSIWMYVFSIGSQTGRMAAHVVGGIVVDDFDEIGAVYVFDAQMLLSTFSCLLGLCLLSVRHTDVHLV
jgi:hypothetical protein